MNNISLEIGKPQEGWLNGAIVNRQYKNLISENQVSYWCYVDKYGFDLKIGKNTLGGARIRMAMQEKVSETVMENILAEIALPHITPSDFANLIQSKYNEGLRDGKNEIRSTINGILQHE